MNTSDLAERSTRKKDSTSAESRTTWEARTRTFWISKSVLSVAPAGCAPAFSDHSAVVASANSISITRFSCGGSIFPQRRMPTWWDAAARPRSRPGAPRRRCGVVDFVETLHALVAVVLPALQQVAHGHCAAVVRSAGRWRRPGRAGRSRRGWAWLGPAGWRRPCS